MSQAPLLSRRGLLESLWKTSLTLGAGSIASGLSPFSQPSLLRGPLMSQEASASPPSSPASRPAFEPPWSQVPLQRMAALDPGSIRYRIAVMTDPHTAIRDPSMDFKVLRLSPLLVDHHFLTVQRLGLLTGRKVDLLLLPGDLTRDSEPWNHQWMQTRLRSLPFPSLVIPGNHDVMKKWLPKTTWGIEAFVAGYQGRFGGYQGTEPWYCHEVVSGLVVIGLNSSDTPDGGLRDTWNGRLDERQLRWFEKTLQTHAGKKQILVMIHHNVLTHHPAEEEKPGNPWRNFHLDNGDEVAALMSKAGSPIVLTGHHHINRIQRDTKLGVTEICTSGACSYPSQIRVLDIASDGRLLTVHTLGLPWPHLFPSIEKAARLDPFWKLPDKPLDAEAMIAFLHGRPEDRFTTIGLPKTRDFR